MFQLNSRPGSVQLLSAVDYADTGEVIPLDLCVRVYAVESILK